MGKKHHKDKLVSEKPLIGKRSTLGYWIGGIVLLLIIVVGIVALARYRDGEGSSPFDVRVDDHVQGSANAPATLIEYGDFQCPSCAAYHPLVKDLQKEYGNRLRFVFRNFPLVSLHQNAFDAARAAEAAGVQNKFWEMETVLFENQADWSRLPNPDEAFASYAQRIGLDAGKFTEDYESYAVRDRVTESIKEAHGLGLSGTPSFFLNGEKIDNPATPDAFKALIDAAIEKRQAEIASSTQPYHAHFDLRTVLGSTVLDLSKPKYQSTAGGQELDPAIHVHNGNGTTVHLHQTGITLAYFYHTLGMTLTGTSFTDEHGATWKNSPAGTLRLFVNDTERTADIQTYIPQDLDRVLLVFGKQDAAAIAREQGRVTDEACIYSETCPERGTPPEEECVGGLGTDCAE